jgi:cytochrome c-type biogenesis protein
VILDLALAFGAGLLSFASTCVLPLVPAYIAYMGGRAIPQPGQPGTPPQLRLLFNALLFVAGFTTAFVALGASAALIAADLRALRPLLLQLAGVALVLIGVALLVFGRVPGLMREIRLDVAHRLPRVPWASYVVGLAFAIGWTPCVGPILAAILIRAGDRGTAGEGAILLAAYSMGLGVPFLAAAGFSGILTRALARVRGAYAAINAAAAIFLIAMGLLIFSNRLTLFNSYFPYIGLNTPFESLAAPSSPRPSTAVAGFLKPGSPAPDFSLKDTDGRTVSLGNLKGKPVLINFWATWCVPCRDELPLIAGAYRAHQDQGFVVVAINFGDESLETVQKYWRDNSLEPPPVLDPQGRASAAYGVALKSSGLPVSVFIARDGTVSRYWPYPLTSDDLNSELRRIL